MDIQDCRCVTEFTRKIFGGTREHSPEAFQEWALEQAKQLVPFDFATWGSGMVLDNQVIIHAVHLHNLAHHDMGHYLEYQSRDPLLEKMVEVRNRIVTLDRYDVLPREQYIELPFYKEYCRPYGFEQTIGTMVPEPLSNLFSAISICRSDYESPFTEREQDIKNVITPVLTEARRHNIFIHMIKLNAKSPHPAAICDIKGVLREAEPTFSKLMLDEWSGWKGPRLSFIPEQLLDGKRSALFRGEKIDIHLSLLHDLVLLQVRHKSPLELLSPAERRVAQQLLQGLSDKEIANCLNISPKTVGHHLQRIYKKAGVANRKQAIARLASGAMSGQEGVDCG